MSSKIELFGDRLWPKPRKVLFDSNCEKRFNFAPNSIINVSFFIANDKHSSFEFVDVINLWQSHKLQFEQLGFELILNDYFYSSDLDQTANGEQTNAVKFCYELKCCINPLLFARKPQCYRLKLDNCIEIASSDLNGLNYALFTLSQIIKYTGNDSFLPSLTIEDWPSFLNRGLCVSSFVNCLKPNFCSNFLDVIGILRINQLFYEIFIEPKSNSNSFQQIHGLLQQNAALQNACKKYLIEICPIYEIGRDFELDFDLSDFEDFIFKTHRHLSKCPILFLGENLSNHIIKLDYKTFQRFTRQFGNCTICFCNIEPALLPFGCGLMTRSVNNVPYQLYFETAVDSFSTSGSNYNFVEYADKEKLSEVDSLGIILMESEKNPIFRTSLLFHLPLMIISCGMLWNVNTTSCDINASSIISEFMKHYVLHSNGKFSHFGNLILELNSIESNLHPEMFQLLTSPDEVPLNTDSCENLLKASKQIRLIRNHLSSYLEPDVDAINLISYAEEALSVCELIQFSIKLGTALCQAGRNPSADKIGLGLVNLGIHNLPATVKTDLANRLITVIQKFRLNLESNYCDETVSKNMRPLYSLLENLIPESTESHETDFQACLADYSVKRFDFGDPCINPAFNATESQLRYLTMCPREAKICQVEITTINKVFSGIERRCAVNCYPTCFTRGYGLEYQACTYCCGSIDPEDFDQETASDYRCPM